VDVLLCALWTTLFETSIQGENEKHSAISGRIFDGWRKIANASPLYMKPSLFFHRLFGVSNGKVSKKPVKSG